MRLTTSPPSYAECHETWEPKPPGTLWATPGLLRDSFTFISANHAAKSNLVSTMLVGHNATNLSVNPHEGRRSDIGLTIKNSRDVLLHRMPGNAVDLAFPIWKVEDVTEMKKKA